MLCYVFFLSQLNSDFYSKLANLNTKKIVITGGPGTGKSTLINNLIKRGYYCLEEISREVILKAQKKGIDQLFLTNPLLFSELLLQGREKQFIDAEQFENQTVFFDRGLPDVLAYMDYIGDEYPENFKDSCALATYDCVFILKPWEDIYTSDNERYESFDQALKIHDHLTSTYIALNYNLIDVPFDTVENRTDFIVNTLNL
jgi:predicted ATPase